jgi:RND family efflux transporter MFP subunit
MVALKKGLKPIVPTDSQGNRMSHSEKTPTPIKLAQIGVTTVALVLLLVWMEGGFMHKTAPGMSDAVAAEAPTSGLTVRVERRETEEIFNWPATVAALTVTQIAPKMSGRILDITVRAGNPVKRNQVLVRLNAAEVRARLEQTRFALVAAEAEALRARTDAARIQNLYHREATTRRDLDSALAGTHAADALTVRAREAVREAQSHLNDAELTAPFDSVVVSRHQEPGDMALPGVPVITLQQSQHLRIEAAIPVTCSDKIALGNVLMARVGTPAREIRVTVDEIQPLADAQTRTVLIKARLPANSGTQPGAFAWLQQACGHESVLLVPAAAVTRIGQLESVRLITDGQTKLRHVRTGKRLGDAVEILSGLSEGDTVQIAGDR